MTYSHMNLYLETCRYASWIQYRQRASKGRRIALINSVKIVYVHKWSSFKTILFRTRFYRHMKKTRCRYVYVYTSVYMYRVKLINWFYLFGTSIYVMNNAQFCYSSVFEWCVDDKLLHIQVEKLVKLKIGSNCQS